MTAMKRTLLFVIVLSVVLFSCKKESVLNTETASTQSINSLQTNNHTARPGTGTGGDSAVVPNITAVTLLAGGNTDAGTVTVTNDANYIYVTYNTTNGYTLASTKLYAGSVFSIPLNQAGNPQMGHFPYSAGHSHITSYTYQIPVSVIGNGNCGAVAAFAELNGGGSAWGNGIQMNGDHGNNAMYIPFCVQY